MAVDTPVKANTCKGQPMTPKLARTFLISSCKRMRSARMPVPACEGAHPAHSQWDTSSAQKKLLEFLCNPKISESQRSSISAAADPWGAATGTRRATRMSSLQVQRDRLSMYAGFSCTSQSSPVSYFPTMVQLQQE